MKMWRSRRVFVGTLALTCVVFVLTQGHASAAIAAICRFWAALGPHIHNTNPGNVGIGTGSVAPTQKLEVVGNIKVSGSGNGLLFPDGSAQTTAVTGGGVPPGLLILSETATAPSGYSFRGVLNTGTDAWIVVNPLGPAREYLAGAALNNKIYAVGGSIPPSLLLDTLSEYTPDFVWVNKANMLAPRNRHTVAVAWGKLYTIGGSVTIAGSATSAVHEYDPSSNTWTLKQSMPTPRYELASGVVSNTIYAIGGYDNGGIAAVEQYDPTTDVWIAKAPLSVPRWGLATAVVNGKIYAVGGSTALGMYDARLEEYDPTINTWTLKTPMPTPRAGLVAAAVHGRIYAIGGRDGSGVINTVEEYDPVTDTWVAKPSMPTARQFPAIGVHGNTLYVIAGGQDASAISDRVERYDPSTQYFVHKKN